MLWSQPIEPRIAWSSGEVVHWCILCPLLWMCKIAQGLQRVKNWRWTEEYSRRYGKFFPQGWGRSAFHDDKWNQGRVNDSGGHGRQRDIKGGKWEIEGHTPLPPTLMTRWLLWHLVSFDHLFTVYLDRCLLDLLRPPLLPGKASIFSVVIHHSSVCLWTVVYCIGSGSGSMHKWLICGKCPMVGVEWWVRRFVADGCGQEPNPSVPSLCGHTV